MESLIDLTFTFWTRREIRYQRCPQALISYLVLISDRPAHHQIPSGDPSRSPTTGNPIAISAPSVTVDTVPSITSNPISRTVVAGSTVSFTAAAVDRPHPVSNGNRALTAWLSRISLGLSLLPSPSLRSWYRTAVSIVRCSLTASGTAVDDCSDSYSQSVAWGRQRRWCSQLCRSRNRKSFLWKENRPNRL